jgi:hypothetical protein
MTFSANTVEDFEGAVREAIAEWRRYNPNQNFLKAGCTVLVEKAVFSCSAQAVAQYVRAQRPRAAGGSR